MSNRLQRSPRREGRRSSQSVELETAEVLHDVRNVLVGIRMFSEMALEALSGESPARMSLERIAAACRQADEMCHTRIAAYRRGLASRVRADLSAVVEETRPMLDASVPETTALEFELLAGLPPLPIETSQLRRVVMNLVMNASQSLGGRTGTVRVSTGWSAAEDKSHSNGEPQAGRFVCLEVADTGCGVDESTRGRMFEAFYTTKRDGGGLGLASVLRIVRGHRGSVAVESQVNRGTRVRVLLPVPALPD